MRTGYRTVIDMIDFAAVLPPGPEKRTIPGRAGPHRVNQSKRRGLKPNVLFAFSFEAPRSFV